MADSKWTATVVRKQFLDFFEKKGHTIGMWRGISEEGEVLSWDCYGLREAQLELAEDLLSFSVIL